jgi:hypothetical protein
LKTFDAVQKFGCNYKRRNIIGASKLNMHYPIRPIFDARQAFQKLILFALRAPHAGHMGRYSPTTLRA